MNLYLSDTLTKIYLADFSLKIMIQNRHFLLLSSNISSNFVCFRVLPGLSWIKTILQYKYVSTKKIKNKPHGVKLQLIITCQFFLFRLFRNHPMLNDSQRAVWHDAETKLPKSHTEILFYDLFARMTITMIW